MKYKKADVFFLTIIIILTIISIDFIVNESHRESIENISKYETFQNLASGLLITFLVCLIGNILPFPTPYTFVLCYSASPFLSLNYFVPLLVGFIASLGCLIGELGGYIVGRGASELISDETKHHLNNLQTYLIEHPKIAPILIFLFGATPLNDDFLTIPLGILKYDIKRTIFFCWLGKLVLMLVFAYNLFNICELIGGESWIVSIVSLYVIVLMIYIIMRVDIVELLKNLAKSKD